MKCPDLMAQWTSKTNSQGWAMSWDLHGKSVLVMRVKGGQCLGDLQAT